MTYWKSKIGVVSRRNPGVRRIKTFPFLLTPFTTPSLTFRLWSSENQIVGVGSRSGRINQWQCTFPRFVIGLVLLLLLPTPTIWFSLDHKLYATDYDSDSHSVASEHQSKEIPRTYYLYVIVCDRSNQHNQNIILPPLTMTGTSVNISSIIF